MLKTHFLGYFSHSISIIHLRKALGANLFIFRATYTEGSLFIPDNFLYISKVFRAVFSHEKSLIRSEHFVIKDFLISSSNSILLIASRRAVISYGSTSTAASPATSDMTGISEAMTGIPCPIASRTGKPNPSISDGKTNTRAFL